MSSPETPSLPFPVAIRGMKFVPNPAIISPGTEIIWSNYDTTDHDLTFTANDGTGPGASGPIPPGGTYRRRFASFGTVAYACTIHPSMKGRIEIVAL